MEEQQIQNFVHRVTADQTFFSELQKDPEGVIKKENLSPRVAQILTRMIPHLTLNVEPNSCRPWWWPC